MKKYPLTATRLRIILSVSMFVTIAIATAIAWLAYAQLRGLAVDVSHTTLDANASQNNIQTLQRIQQKLAGEKDVIERARGIVADSQTYQYQDQIINDLQKYAAKAGVAITNLDFTASTTTTAPPAAGTAVAPAGVKSTSASITLKTPIDYDALLRFLRSIEQNLTKMQISRISLSKGTTGSEVLSEVLTIEVYIR